MRFLLKGPDTSANMIVPNSPPIEKRVSYEPIVMYNCNWGYRIGWLLQIDNH